jgi:hypothetical protein
MPAWASLARTRAWPGRAPCAARPGAAYVVRQRVCGCAAGSVLSVSRDLTPLQASRGTDEVESEHRVRSARLARARYL